MPNSMDSLINEAIAEKRRKKVFSNSRLQASFGEPRDCQICTSFRRNVLHIHTSTKTTRLLSFNHHPLISVLQDPTNALEHYPPSSPSAQTMGLPRPKAPFHPSPPQTV